MADRPAISVNKFQAATRAKEIEEDRRVAASLRYAIWAREGREGRPPDCAPWLRLIAEALGKAHADELVERREGLLQAGMLISAAVCWELVQVVEARTVH